jgi:hypothetical protein
MDIIDRIQLCVRYNILALLSLFGYVDSVSFNNQLRKVNYIIVNNESVDEIQSEGSNSCYVAEDTFQCVGHNQDSGSDRTGESNEEAGSEEVTRGQSDGGEDNQ